MKVTEFYEKLNKVDGNVYVIEEKVCLADGSYEGQLLHDNINTATLAVFTGPKLTGKRLQSYALSTPSMTPWKKVIRVYADVPEVYISYETDGDIVEAEDINRLQEAIVAAQEAIGEENVRAKAAEKVNQEAITAEAERAGSEETELQEKIRMESNRAVSAEDAIRNTISVNRPNWDDKYTRNEVDNKFSLLETAIDWKEAVDTYEDLAASYAEPDDGWTVNVKDTDYTYRWNGSAWIAISANAIPKATRDVDGLLCREDKAAFDEAYVKCHEHGNREVLDNLSQAMLDKLAGIAEEANQYVHPTSPGYLHIPSGGAGGQILRWSADGTAVWGEDNNTTYSSMKGATSAAAGSQGLVPPPAAGMQGQFLRGDGIWAVPPSTSYTHPDSGAAAGTYRSVTVDTQGHVTGGTNPTTLAEYGITDAAEKLHSHDSIYLKKGVITWGQLKGGA